MEPPTACYCALEPLGADRLIEQGSMWEESLAFRENRKGVKRSSRNTVRVPLARKSTRVASSCDRLSGWKDWIALTSQERNCPERHGFRPFRQAVFERRF